MKKGYLILCCLILLTASTACAETYTFNIGSWEKSKDTGYEIITAYNTRLAKMEGRLNEPVGVQKYPLPHDKAIKSVKLIKKANPVKLSINLPLVEYDESGEFIKYRDRDCTYQNERPAIISEAAYYNYKEPYLEVNYYPLEINNCKNGDFTLYREMQIEIEYNEPNKIKSVTNTEFNPGKPATIHIEYENVVAGDYIVVVDENNPDAEEIEEFIIQNYDDIEVVPATHEVLYLIYYYNEYDEIVDRAAIFEDLSWGSIDFRALVSEDVTVFPLAVEIKNKLKKDISIHLLIRSVDLDLETQTTLEKTITAGPGLSMHYINFKVGDNEVTNDIYLEATYNGITEYVAHSTLYRHTKEEVKAGLPVPPGVGLMEELNKDLALETEKQEDENKKKQPLSSNLATSVGIIIALLLTIVVIYIALKYMRQKPHED